MKKWGFFFSAFIFVSQGFGQIQLDAFTRSVCALWAQMGKAPAGLSTVSIEGKTYVSAIAKTSDEPLQLPAGIRIGSRIGQIVTLKIPTDQPFSWIGLSGLTYLEFAQKVKPQLEKARKDVRADSVHAGLGLPAGFTGKDVYIGVTDWGFDYTHPFFFDSAMQETRIVAAWDQFKAAGPAPSGFGYGTSYTGHAALQQAKTDTSNIYGVHYHGTHVAGIAAGNGYGTTHIGLAPGAQLLMVTFLVDAGAVLDAFQWMKQQADLAGKRLVINMSWGLYHMGTMDGTSLLSQAIQQYANQGVIFVTSAGNNGDVAFHLQRNFQQDSLRTRVETYPFSAHNDLFGQSILAWGTPQKPFVAGIEFYNSSGQFLMQTPRLSTNWNGFLDSTFVLGTDSVRVIWTADAAHPLNQRPHMRIRVQCKNSGWRVALFAQAQEGEVHFWNVTDLETDVGNWGMPFSNQGFSGWVQGNRDFGIGEPACAAAAISVGAYVSEYTLGTSSVFGGQLAQFSSRGPLITGAMKPDITAPGGDVISAINRFTDDTYPAGGFVNFQGQNYPYAPLSGTSMAGPVVAGVVALMLEAHSGLSYQQVRDILFETARQDNKTGVIPDTGSTRWGFGKVHAWRAVYRALEVASLPPVSNKQQAILFPNPSQHEVKIQLPEGWTEAYLTLFHVDGRIRLEETLVTSSSQFSTKDWNVGLYTGWLRYGNQRIPVKLSVSANP